jgi:hypothetical protein
MKVKEVAEARAAGKRPPGARRGGEDLKEVPFATVPITVLQDKRLSHRQLRVLLALLSFRAPPAEPVCASREQIAARCGLPVTRISQITTALCELGWLVKRGEGGRSKSCHYRIIDAPGPEAQTVTDLVTVTDSVTDLSPQTITDSVTEMETVRPGVRGLAQTKRTQQKRAPAPGGSRLPAHWGLPGAWGAWALQERPDWSADHLHWVTLQFRDYWLAKAGPDARKVDWQATWRNWVRREPARRTFAAPGAGVAAARAAENARAKSILFGAPLETLDV